MAVELGRFTAHFANQVAEVILGMISKAEIIYFDYAENELYRENIGPCKSGDEIKYTVPTLKGWKGFKTQALMDRAHILFKKEDGTEVLWINLGRGISAGSEITVRVPITSDIYFE